MAGSSGVSPQALKDTLISYHQLDEAEWSLSKRSKDKDVSVWQRSSQEFSGSLYKAQGVVRGDPQRTVDFLRPGARRLDWDSMMTSMEILETPEQGCCVVKYTTSGQLWNIISPREFVDFSYTSEYERGLLSCGVSVDREQHSSGFVRGFNHACGWFCVPTDVPALSLLTGYIQTDLRGHLPRAAVDSAMASGLITFYSDLQHALDS